MHFYRNNCCKISFSRTQTRTPVILQRDPMHPYAWMTRSLCLATAILSDEHALSGKTQIFLKKNRFNSLRARYCKLHLKPLQLICIFLYTHPCQINYYAHEKVKLTISTLLNLTLLVTGVTPTILISFLQHIYSSNPILRFILPFSEPIRPPDYAHCYLTLHLFNSTPLSMLSPIQHCYTIIHFSLYIVSLWYSYSAFLKLKIY